MSSSDEPIDVPGLDGGPVKRVGAPPSGTEPTPLETDGAASVGGEVDGATAAETDVSTSAVVNSPPPAGSEGEVDPPPTAQLEAEDSVANGGETPPLAEIIDALTRIERGLAEYDRLLTRQADVASRLHGENQELKQGEFRQAQTSLVLGVIRVIDDISQMSETAEEVARSDLLLIGESLEDTLERHGVERLHVSVGDLFDGKVHKIAQVAATEDKSLNRTVAGIRRPGFSWVDGTAIRVADVVVYKFVPGPEPASESDSQDPPKTSVVERTPDPPE